MPPPTNFRKQTYNFFATARNIDAVEHDPFAANDSLAWNPIVSMLRACERGTMGILVPHGAERHGGHHGEATR